MQLYLVRHGKAEAGTDDDRRRLTDGGKKAVQRIARRLAAAKVRVDRIEHSGLVRAAETAEIIADTLDAKVEAVTGLRPSDDVTSTARRLEGTEESSLMLVGHLPFMERLASYLLTGDEEACLLHFRTASIACFSGSGPEWVLEWFLPPDLA